MCMASMHMASSSHGEPIRISSYLPPIGCNQIEPVVGRPDCQLPASLHVKSPWSEPRTGTTILACGATDPGASQLLQERSSASRVDQPKSLDDLISVVG